MAKTGGHFSRCNVGSVEAHNERTQAYLDGVKAAGLPLYFFQNLTVNNTHWMSDRQEFAGKTCAQIFESLKQLYTEKTGQAPQLKDRTRINKKTGKEYTVAGWSPIREAVIPIKEDTTVEDFKPVFAWLRLNGLEPIRLDLHKDEGYEDEETGEKKMNYHGHLVVCWVDLQTGKTANLKKDKMSEFNQKVLPEALGMEAGESKAITGKEHLTPAAQRAKAEVERLEAKAAAVEEKVQHLEERHDQLERENTRLQVANTTKAAAVAVGQSIAGVFGQSRKDKTIQQLQDTIAHEPERTATAVASARTDERQKVITEIKKAADLHITGKDGKETAEDIGKAWRRNFNDKKTLATDIANLKDKHQTELEKKDRVITQKEATIRQLQGKFDSLMGWVNNIWETLKGSLDAIVQRVNDDRDYFTHEEVKAVEKGMVNAKEEEREGYAKDICTVAATVTDVDEDIRADVMLIARRDYDPSEKIAEAEKQQQQQKWHWHP